MTYTILSCKKINLKNVCIYISIHIYTHKLREIPMANTFPGSMILKFMQIKVRENTLKPKSNQLPDSKPELNLEEIIYKSVTTNERQGEISNSIWQPAE